MSLDPATGRLAKGLPAAAPRYKGYVGPVGKYDQESVMQFTLLAVLGLREHHFLLDIGCGSLRGGKLFIPYLLSGHYYGVEPEPWLIDQGIDHELGREILRVKEPTFSHDREFGFAAFSRQFDYLLAQSIFSHASEPQIRRCLAQAKDVMKPSAVFAATFREGTENYQGQDWVYPGTVPYTREHMVDLVAEHGLCCQPIEWPHPNRQTWMLIAGRDALARLPKCFSDPALSSSLVEVFGPALYDDGKVRWHELKQQAQAEIAALVPAREAFILVDDLLWENEDTVAGRRRFPFLERDGQYWGLPADDATAISELERLRGSGATHVVFAWPSFWWLDHYLGLRDHLLARFRCVLDNESVIAFDLRSRA